MDDRAVRQILAIMLIISGGSCNSHAPSVAERPHPVDAFMFVNAVDGEDEGTARAGTPVVISGTYSLDDRSPHLLRPNVFVEIVRGKGKEAATMASHSAKQIEDGELIKFECRLDAPDKPGTYTVAVKHARREGVTILASRELTVLPVSGAGH